MSRAKPAIIAATWMLVLLVAWMLVARFIDDRVILPGPGEVWSRAQQLLFASGSTMWTDVGYSITRVMTGWALGIAVGVPLGALMSTNQYLRIPLDLILQAGRAVPPLAFIPLLIVWLGIGETSKIFLIFVATVPIITVATVAGIEGVDKSLERAALTLGASRWTLVRKVVIPATIPDIITAMRISLGLAWSCVVAAELIASTEGIGYRILQAGRYLETETIFVGIIVIAVLALISDISLRLLYGLASPWRGTA
ncbi:ABC transporter permease [Mycobacterium sp. 21AC1]|uniref:ABC transporter permease n=1 Tax=[Mycobacterium] appelbergii TaxID=2939269 RepID=UPI002939356D|nr:ABC transporter permease [Mycobacterium sp. 21AC1]MDV3128425.1 ABC transporter permease [Mycobacterium sp. 21AC1]